MSSDRPPHLRLLPDPADATDPTAGTDPSAGAAGTLPFDEPPVEPARTEPTTVMPGASPFAMVYDPEELFQVLATGIRGTAVDWPADSLARLRSGLLERFGHDLGPEPEAAVARLVILARNPAAA